jgi:hypothetical protein
MNCHTGRKLHVTDYEAQTFIVPLKIPQLLYALAGIRARASSSTLNELFVDIIERDFSNENQSKRKSQGS